MGSVLSIDLKCSVPQKGIDIINELIASHKAAELEDRAMVSNNTARFISERINFISQELGDVESEVEQYKRSNKLTDISSEANLYLQSGSESEGKIIELSSQLSLVNLMISELNLTNTSNVLIPSNMGLQDETIAALIANYNKTSLEISRIKKNAGIKNPIVENYEKQLLALKNSINESLFNTKKTLEIRIKDFQKAEESNQNRIAQVPKFEREFRNIYRQQQIKETLYLFLLQKREETNISISGNVSNSKIIDAGFSSGSMIWPNTK
jgi:uncharacterized protein involved in exopolysaccharide biosynthesis